ncbi:TlpA disulfide reductase family protein [Porifericola rhodea]|uniref:TlpA family protein disulfide reductase n=1 Tax=Porifericola rhodea TaxID=930972 RepID=UPI002666DAD4|nr:TlpA disulfide reductase family protein [Porifericola rhodea]WKN30695.1 TlpA disulfide reductase family protein [Porifericola rhodea]
MKKLRKNIDLLLLALFVGVVYLGGWQTDVIGFLQRGILATGLFNADAEVQEVTLNEENKLASFTLIDNNGEPYNSQEYKGKTVFINFWASWCPPCVAEMPGIDKLYQDLKDREDIVFLIISEDEDQEKALSFMKKRSYHFPIYFPGSALPQSFLHQSIPSTFVISPEGKIVYKHEGMAQYNTDKFKAFLKSFSSSPASE